MEWFYIGDSFNLTFELEVLNQRGSFMNPEFYYIIERYKKLSNDALPNIIPKCNESSKYHFSGSCNDQGVGVYLLHLDSDSS